MENKHALPISKVISKILKEIGYSKRAARADICQIWNETAGEQASRHTRVAGFKRGMLTIEVDSASWLQELSNFYKGEILEKLRQNSKKLYIADLKFKLAHWENNKDG